MLLPQQQQGIRYDQESFVQDSAAFHLCIGGFEQLAHLMRIRKQSGGLFSRCRCQLAGDDCDLGGFPGLAECCVFGLEVGVAAYGDQGGHVERILHALAATADE